MSKIALYVTLLLSFSASAQPIECSLMKEEILSQYRYQQQMQNDPYKQQYQQNQAMNYAQMTPMQQAQAGIYMGGQQLGNAINQMMSGPSLDEKVKIYKQKCE
jgi:hypothetical protein